MQATCCLQDQRHMSVRQRFRRYLQHGPPTSIHGVLQSFAKLAVCYARHTVKHFFTASLGEKKHKEKQEIITPKPPGSGKGPP